ncbi:MAG: L-dopachrome tautomerase-related protein, partial [Bradymonadaceae bacterium]
FVTDASEVGLNGLITIDLASGRARRRLDRHPSTRATPDFVPFVERRPVYFDLKDAKPGHLTLGAHGVALSGDRQRLFYAPLASRRLYSVSVDALLDPSMPPWRVEDTLRRYGDLGFATDGMATGPDGALYLSNFEDGAIVRFRPGHVMESVVRDPRLLWPDSLAIRGGYLYVTVTQRHRQHVFNDGKDLAEPPYVLYRAPLPEYARP